MTMVYEMAHIRIDPAEAAAFEAAVAACAPLFRAAHGCRSMTLERQVEDAACYVLRIGWDRVEDHMVTFRDSPAFHDWRATVGGFFAAPPVVVHQAAVIAGF